MLLIALVLAAQPAGAQPDDRSESWTRQRRQGAVVRILSDYHLGAGSTASDPIIVIGGSATIDGRVEDDLIVIGGRLRVGPTAVIEGDLVTVGRAAIIDPSAEVGGEIAQTVVTWPDFRVGRPRLDDRWWVAAAWAVLLVRLVFVLMVSVFLTIVAPRWIGAVAERVAAAAGVSGLIGLAGETLFVPALVLVAIALGISIVGIPLLGAVPLLVGAAGVVSAAGFAGAAARIGASLRGSRRSPSAATIGDVVLGFAAISAVSVIAHVMALGSTWLSPFAFTTGAAGLLIEYVAWTVGLGAALGSLMGNYRSPPPLPAAVRTASPSAT